MCFSKSYFKKHWKSLLLFPVQFCWGYIYVKKIFKGTLLLRKYLFNFFKTYIYFGCGCGVAVCVQWYACGGKKTTFGSWSSLLLCWSRVTLRSPGLVASTFTKVNLSVQKYSYREKNLSLNLPDLFPRSNYQFTGNKGCRECSKYSRELRSQPGESTLKSPQETSFSN